MSKSSEQLLQHSIWIYCTTPATPCSGVLCLLQDIEHVHVLSQIQINATNDMVVNTISGSFSTSRCGTQMHWSCVKPSCDEHVSRLGSHGAHWTSPRDKSLKQNGYKGPATCANFQPEKSDNKEFRFAIISCFGISFWLKRNSVMPPRPMPLQRGMLTCRFADFPNSFCQFCLDFRRKLWPGHSRHLLLKAAIPLLISRYASHAIQHAMCTSPMAILYLNSSMTLLYLYSLSILSFVRESQCKTSTTIFIRVDIIGRCKPMIASWAFLMDSHAGI